MLRYLLLLFLISGSLASAMSQLDSIGIELHEPNPEGVPEGFQVYRLYAYFEEDNPYLLRYFGGTFCSFELQTTGSFWNSPQGFYVIKPEQYLTLSLLYPSIIHDSYLTIGADENFPSNEVINIGVPSDVEEDLENSFGSAGSGVGFSSNAFAVQMPFVGTFENGFPQDGKVLIAQLTTDGEIYYKINLEVVPDVDNWSAAYYNWDAENPCSPPESTQSAPELNLQRVLYFCSDPEALNYDSNPFDWAEEDNGTCSYAIPSGCTDPIACNFDDEAVEDDGSCLYPNGCLDPLACNYNPDSNCDDGTCQYPDGCTDSSACNFNATATCDDGTCEYITCAGCIDPTACNYEQGATLDDGSCFYPNGCTDVFACNFDALATCDDGSCSYDSCYGCMDPEACNYDVAATFNDNSCTYPDGCTDEAACNYLFWADCDDGSCEFVSCLGCTDASACNFDMNATQDDGSCVLPDGCTDSSACNYNDLASCDDGSCDFNCYGCTDPLGCNYAVDATIDDGSCLLPDGCTDPVACNYSDTYLCDDGSCEYDSCAGCTDPIASNYDSAATIDDGSCEYECTLNEVELTWIGGTFFNDDMRIVLKPYGSPEVLFEREWNHDLEEDSFDWCLATGCYEVHMYDDPAIGDGWNGAWLNIEQAGISEEFTLQTVQSSFEILAVPPQSECLIAGCTDSTAENYDPFAVIDNDTCVFDAQDEGTATVAQLKQLKLSASSWDNADFLIIHLDDLIPLLPTEIVISDVLGKVCFRDVFSPSPRETSVDLNLNLPMGVGVYQIEARQENQRVRMLYMRR